MKNAKIYLKNDILHHILKNSSLNFVNNDGNLMACYQ